MKNSFQLFTIVLILSLLTACASGVKEPKLIESGLTTTPPFEIIEISFLSCKGGLEHVGGSNTSVSISFDYLKNGIKILDRCLRGK